MVGRFGFVRPGVAGRSSASLAPSPNDAPKNEESRLHRRAKNVSRGHSAITEPAFHGPAARGSAHARLGSQAQTWQKIRNTTMFVKWAIVKLLITMHLAMPADILTKAVDLETHTKMRNLMMNIPWVYRILSESRPPSGKRGRGAQNLVIKYGTSARDRTRRCGT